MSIHISLLLYLGAPKVAFTWGTLSTALPVLGTRGRLQKQTQAGALPVPVGTKGSYVKTDTGRGAPAEDGPHLEKKPSLGRLPAGAPRQGLRTGKEAPGEVLL